MEELPEETLHRFQMLERKLSAQRGPFSLFALFLRENSPGRWDIFASASWAEQRIPDPLMLFDRLIRSEFHIEEQVILSQIALVAPRGPEYEAAMHRIARAVRAASGSAELEHGLVEMRDVDLFGQTIDRAYIITAQPLTVPVPA